MAELFKDIIPSILERKVDVLNNPKDYVPYVVNRALSYHSDCLFDANQMNMLSGLDKRTQYEFFMQSIKPSRRPYAKWIKPVKKEDLEDVKTYFNYGDREAIAALGVLTEEQLVTIRDKVKIS